MTKPDPAKVYAADMTGETGYGRVRLGERRRGTDPAVVGLPDIWLEDPATDAELAIHAAARSEAAYAAGQAASAARAAHEAERGPVHLTPAEGGSDRA